MNEIPNDYEPKRSSAKTQQFKLIASIDDLQKRLAQARAKSETGADYAFQSLAYGLKKQLNISQEKLQAFNDKEQKMDAYRSGAAAKEARFQVIQFAAAFEKALLQAAKAATELSTQAAGLADILHVKDAGLWPSRGAVADAMRSRVIHIFGDHSTVRLPGYGSSSAKPSRSLTDQFKLNQ